MSIRESRAERAMNHAFVVILILLSALMLFPFINLLAKSVSGEAAVLTGSVYLLPKDFQLGTYEYVVNQPQFFNSFWNSLFITVVGTALAMVVNCLTAYPLSKTWIVGRKGADPVLCVHHALQRRHGAQLFVDAHAEPHQQHLGADPTRHSLGVQHDSAEEFL